MKLLGLPLAIAVLVLVTARADARPAKRPAGIAKRSTAKTATPVAKRGAHARIKYSRAGELRQVRDIQPRRTEPLTAEESAAAKIQKLLDGPLLRRGITGLFVADARTGEPLFAVNASDPMNPASNVKLISTAAALELLGPDFKYPTRLLGPAPVGGVVKGDVYLLGSYDPTLTSTDMHEIAGTLARAGITSIDGSITVSSRPTRDGIYRSVIPIEITAGEPGQPPTAVVPANFSLVDVKVVATTSKKAHRPRLTFKTELVKTEQNYPRIALTIGGKIGKGGATMYPLWTKQRTANAAYSLIAALRAHSISITGEMKIADLGDFVSDSVMTGRMPVELGRHESARLADIIRRVNKWSINWLADRVIMTASALARRQEPSMELALEEMYGWLARHPQVDRENVVLDTGSGLSYRTEITMRELVGVIRAAGGFLKSSDPQLAQAWLRSLPIAASDGTLRSRFRSTDAAGRILGKTGTLSTVIALSGILDTDPTRPLAFALVTNTDSPLIKTRVRKAHEQVIGEICKYLTATAQIEKAPPPVVVPAATSPGVSEPEGESEIDAEDAVQSDTALDAETARSQ